MTPNVGTKVECFYCGADVKPDHAFMDRLTGKVKCPDCVRHDRDQRLIAAGLSPKPGECHCDSCVTEGLEPQRPDCWYWKD